ncbi:MAG: CBS domain-containing protein [Gammaproteobacteria bacterium]|nr:CBS domain-containing protein [Gammaproteobacteria bacterium]
MITVNEVMTTNVISLSPHDTVLKAADIMTKHNIRHIPVVSTKNQVVGIVSQRDVLRSGALSWSTDHKNENSGQQEIAEIMSKGTLSTHPKDSLRAAGLTLQKHKYGCLPVVENGLLVGIITDTDFVSVAINLIEEKDSLEEEEIEEIEKIQMD